MINISNLSSDMKKAPYQLTVAVKRQGARNFLAKIINFAHLQISSKRAIGFSILLAGHIDKNNDIHFSDQGNLLDLVVRMIKIVYNIQLKRTKMKRINVVPIFSGGLVRYMNNPNSMFHYLKPMNENNRVIMHFKTHGYPNLKRAIAEYAVMALSLIHYTEISVRKM